MSETAYVTTVTLLEGPRVVVAVSTSLDTAKRRAAEHANIDRPLAWTEWRDEDRDETGLTATTVFSDYDISVFPLDN